MRKDKVVVLVVLVILISSIRGHAGTYRLQPAPALRCNVFLPGEARRALELQSQEREKQFFLGGNSKAIRSIASIENKLQQCRKTNSMACKQDLLIAELDYSTGLMLKITRNPADSRFRNLRDGGDRFRIDLFSRIQGPGIAGERLVSHASTEVLSKVSPIFAIRPTLEDEKFLKYASAHYVSCETVQLPQRF